VSGEAGRVFIDGAELRDEFHLGPDVVDRI
jgi:hypothetical protein